MPGLWYYFIGAADGNCKNHGKFGNRRGPKGKRAKPAPKPKPATASK